LQESQGPPSRLHAYDTRRSREANVNVAEVLSTVPDSLRIILVSGGGL
jgi:hypothetical protein